MLVIYTLSHFRMHHKSLGQAVSLMARISNFSIATGDFKMLSGTFDAVTTTSFPQGSLCCQCNLYI